MVDATRETYNVTPIEFPTHEFKPYHWKVLAALQRYHMLHNRQLVRLLKNVDAYRWARQLQAGGYTAKPQQRKWAFPETGGQRPWIYTITEKGLKALHKHGDISAPSIDWTKNRPGMSANGDLILHDMGIWDARIGFELTGAEDVWPLSFHNGKLQPDRGFKLGTLYAYECDCGTEKHEIIRWKCERYNEALKRENARVLFTTMPPVDEPQRVRNIARDAKAVSKAVNRFLVCDHRDFVREGPFGVDWMNAAEELVKL